MSKGIEKCTAEKDIWMKPMKYWAILDQEAFAEGSCLKKDQKEKQRCQDQQK